MHGLGDSSAGFTPLFLSKNSPVPKTFKIVLPTAPYRAVTINYGMPSTSWFDIKSLDAPKDNDFEKVWSISKFHL
jgi:phospholipase/carboxylesterase